MVSLSDETLSKGPILVVRLPYPRPRFPLPEVPRAAPRRTAPITSHTSTPSSTTAETKILPCPGDSESKLPAFVAARLPQIECSSDLHRRASPHTSASGLVNGASARTYLDDPRGSPVSQQNRGLGPLSRREPERGLGAALPCGPRLVLGRILLREGVGPAAVDPLVDKDLGAGLPECVPQGEALCSVALHPLEGAVLQDLLWSLFAQRERLADLSLHDFIY